MSLCPRVQQALVPTRRHDLLPSEPSPRRQQLGLEQERTRLCVSAALAQHGRQPECQLGVLGRELRGAGQRKASWAYPAALMQQAPEIAPAVRAAGAGEHIAADFGGLHVRLHGRDHGLHWLWLNRGEAQQACMREHGGKAVKKL
eukprot:scaffold8513_cov111-Isochrysis_galbana.AAC.4